MTEEELAQIVARLRLVGSDTQQVEVKDAAGGLPKSIPETLSAFANGGGGLIILGLTEAEGFLPAAKFSPKTISDALAGACHEKLEPPVRALIEQIPFEGSRLVVAQVPGFEPRDKPCFIKDRGRHNGSYIRTGDGDRRLSADEVDRLLENRRQPEWDLEVVPDATLADLDEAMWRGTLDRERILHPRIFKALDEEKALVKLRILSADSLGRLRPTLAGLLCFGTYPQQFFPRLAVTYAVYPGTSKASILTGQRFIDSGALVGPIPALVADGVAMVARNMRIGGVVSGTFRQDLVDYPLVAVREALTNALMHRDYSPQARGTQVQLNIFADRLEVLNPGGLFGTVTLANLGKDGISSARNQRLSQLLEMTPYEDGGMVAENRGSGYQEIVSQLARNMLPDPRPRDELTAFSLTFERRRMTDAERGAAAGASSREQVLAYLADHVSASSRELAGAAGIGVGGVRRVLSALVAEGLVERSEPARSPKQRYRLTRNPQHNS